MNKGLSVDGLSIRTVAGGAPIVRGVTLHLPQGRTLGIVGESGSGKTTTALALLGHVRPGLEISGGTIAIDETDVLTLTGDALNEFRQTTVAYVPQDPASALNPALRLGTQLKEMFPAHLQDGASTRISVLLEEVGLDPKRSIRSYPHQLSGGQRRRVAIAMALLRTPSLLILDEITSGLDSSTQKSILAMIGRLCSAHNTSALFVTHDLAVVRQVTDDLLVMRAGEVVEQGATVAILRDPQHPYTQRLIAADPGSARDPATPSSTIDTSPRLAVDGLSASYQDTTVLHNATFDVRAGECLAIVGESGAGKSTLARSIVGLHQNWTGTVSHDGRPLPHSARRRTPAVLKQIQFIFQDPYSSLNPRRTVGQILSTPARRFTRLRAADRERAIVATLESVALDASFLTRSPDELSGGQRQRVAIARALLAEPDILVCDEITSALDVTVQAAVIETLRQIQLDRQLTIIFITHNLPLVRQIADRIAVMRYGEIVEINATATMFATPSHPYTRQLFADQMTVHPAT